MSKVISFRVSDVEFEELKTKSQGNVNDYIKSCIQAVYKDNCDNCERIQILEKELEDERETIHVTTNCEHCEKTKELSRALLENAELQQKLEQVKAPVDCTACERIAELEKELEGGKEKYQQQRTAEAERIKEIEKSAEEWQETAKEYKKEGEAKIKFWASIAAAALLLFITTLIFAIIK